MNSLSRQSKTLTFDLVVAQSRSTVDIITAIACVLKVVVGEQDQYEYVQLRQVQHINKEVSNATQSMEH